MIADSLSQPRQGAPVILRIVALAVEEDTARLGGMSEMQNHDAVVAGVGEKYRLC